MLLASISNSLETELENKSSSKTWEFSSLSTVRHCYVYQFIVRDWVKGWCSVIARFGSLICRLEHGEAGLAPGATVWSC